MPHETDGRGGVAWPGSPPLGTRPRRWPTHACAEHQPSQGGWIGGRSRGPREAGDARRARSHSPVRPARRWRMGRPCAVKCTVFLADIRDYAAMSGVYATYFPTDPPARSMVAGSGLALGARVEIECLAVAG